MKRKNGYTIIDLLIVIVIMGVVTFATISKFSYALTDNKDELYKLEEKLIETQAAVYGATIIDELKEKSTTVTINHLINEKYLSADDESGNIYDPRDERETLNDKKVKLSYDEKKDKVIAELEK